MADQVVAFELFGDPERLVGQPTSTGQQSRSPGRNGGTLTKTSLRPASGHDRSPAHQPPAPTRNHRLVRLGRSPISHRHRSDPVSDEIDCLRCSPLRQTVQWRPGAATS